MLALRSVSDSAINGQIDWKDDQQRDHELNKTSRNVVSVSENK